MTYRAIADSEVDAYSPVTGRLAFGYRDNIEAVGIRFIAVTSRDNYTPSLGATYSDVGTFSIYVPAICRGPSGTRFYIPSYLKVTVAATNAATVYLRWKLGSSTSDETYTTATGGETTIGTSTLNTYLTLDCSTTANTTAALIAQGYYTGDTPTLVNVAFDSNQIRGYAAALPFPGGY